MLLFAAVGGAATGGDKGQSEKIKKIQKERLDNATKLFDYLKETYFAGGLFRAEATVERVIHARAQLLKLQLEQTTVHAERTKAYEKAIQDISVLKARAVALNEKFNLKYDVFRLTGYYLELEYALEREKQGKKVPPSSD
jgi:hypothetical protein